MTREIPLTKGLVALVDDEDYEELSKYKWSAHYSKSTNGYYATRELRMHNAVIEPRRGFEIDHVNRNGLDNRKSNLREVTHRENCFNSGKRGGPFSGVCRKRDGWTAQIQVGGENLYAVFKEYEDALVHYEFMKFAFIGVD